MKKEVEAGLLAKSPSFVDIRRPSMSMTELMSLNEQSEEEASDKGVVEQTAYGMLYMLMGSTSMGLMNVGAKILKINTTVSVLQLGLFRALVMVLGCYGHARIIKVDILDIPQDKAKWVFARAFFGFLSYMFQFTGIYMLPLSLAVVLYFTQPISAAIINWLFNNEKLSGLQILSIVSALLGVLILTNPRFIFPWIDEAEAYSYDMDDYP